MGPNPQETADLVTFTEEILNEKPHFLCSEVVKDSLIRVKIFKTFTENRVMGHFSENPFFILSRRNLKQLHS